MVSELLPQYIRKRLVVVNGCWVWPGVKAKGGYGKTKRNGRTMLVHVLAYESEFGPVPPGLQLDHLCKNTACANPAHLQPVTCRENIMRGEGVAAKNARKTHCPKGHPYGGKNLRFKDGGRRRRCRACDSAKAKQMRLDAIARGMCGNCRKRTLVLETICDVCHDYIIAYHAKRRRGRH